MMPIKEHQFYTDKPVYSLERIVSVLEYVLAQDEKSLANPDHNLQQTVLNLLQYLDCNPTIIKDLEEKFDASVTNTLTDIAQVNFAHRDLSSREKLYALNTFSRVRDVLTRPALPLLQTVFPGFTNDQILSLARAFLDAKDHSSFMNFIMISEVLDSGAFKVKSFKDLVERTLDIQEREVSKACENAFRVTSKGLELEEQSELERDKNRAFEFLFEELKSALSLA